MRKLTPKLTAEIQAYAARTGARRDEMAAKFGVATGTISNALKAAKPNRKARRAAAKAKPESARTIASDAPMPTGDELRSALAAQVRSLQAEIANAESPAHRASLQRLIVATQALLARLLPPEPVREDLNAHPDFVAAAKRARDALHHKITTYPDDAPKCRTCLRPMEKAEQ